MGTAVEITVEVAGGGIAKLGNDVARKRSWPGIE
jgi:hypothetical protein